MFTLITATYNAATLFDRTAESLRGQIDQDFQWIVVDGASRDDTVDHILRAGDLIAEWISEPDRGIADAWNKGLSRAQGEYVVMANAGDTYDPSFLSRVRAHADGCRIVCCNARVLSENGTEVGLLRAEPYKLYRAMHVPHNWCAVPLQLYRELGGYKELPQAMDFEWFHRYFKQNGTAGFAAVDEALGSYYLGGTSDVNFAESFRMKERIIVANGGNRIRARILRLLYTAKHALWRHGR